VCKTHTVQCQRWCVVRPFVVRFVVISRKLSTIDPGLQFLWNCSIVSMGMLFSFEFRDEHGANSERTDDASTLAAGGWPLILLPRDAMHKRGLSRCICPSVCLSVCPSVTFVYSIETSKRIFNFFHHRVATPFWFFSYQTLRYYSDGKPLTWAKIAIFNQYPPLALTTAGPSRIVNISKVEYRF